MIEKAEFTNMCMVYDGDKAVVIDRQKDDIELLGIEHKAIRTEAIKEFCEKRGIEYVETDI